MPTHLRDFRTRISLAVKSERNSAIASWHAVTAKIQRICTNPSWDVIRTLTPCFVERGWRRKYFKPRVRISVPYNIQGVICHWHSCAFAVWQGNCLVISRRTSHANQQKHCDDYLVPEPGISARFWAGDNNADHSRRQGI